MTDLINRLLKHPKTLISAVLLISGFFFWEMKTNVRMETDLDEYMPKDHPAFMYSDSAETRFNILDGIIFAIETENGIYNEGTLKKIKDLTKVLEGMDEIEKGDVTSLYTADNIVGEEGSLEVNAFYRKVPKSIETLDALRRNVEANEMVNGRLVSSDGRTALVIARIADDVFNEDFYSRLIDLAAEYEGPEKVHIAGSPIVEGSLASLMPKDMSKMVPLVIVVIFVTLVLLLRQFSGSLLILLSVLFASIWTFGLMGWIGIPLYSVSTMIPVMLIAIGVAYGVHLLNHYQLHLQENPESSREEAVSAMIRTMTAPVSMAAFTTMVGFLSLLTSSIYPIRYFGLFTAFGVLIELFLSLLFLSAGLILFGGGGTKNKADRKAGQENEQTGGFVSRFTNWLSANHLPVLITASVLIVLSIWGSSRIWIDSSFLDKFEKDSDIVLTDAFINSHFGGTSTLNVILEGPDGSMKSPEVLQLAAKMQKRTEDENALVGSSFGLSDYLERMNKVMHADDPAYENVPDDPDLIAQYLLLYEMSGDPENLWKVVDYNYESANITFQLKSDNSKALEAAMTSINAFSDRFADLDVTVHYAGSGYKAYVFTDLILEGQIKSLLLSVVIVVLLLAIMFRSILIGLIGSVPIILTTVITFGTMGILGIPLSTTTALISSIAVGIGIDYAVHLISTFRRNLEENGDLELSSRITVQTSGRAILFNALVVIAGFMVLLASVFPPNRTLGALISLNMAVSFLGTMTVLFILISRYFAASVRSNTLDDLTDNK